MLLQASSLFGVQDLRVALALLLVSRIVKDRSAMKSIGGPAFLVQTLEDGDARMCHAAASFLQVCHIEDPICTTILLPWHSQRPYHSSVALWDGCRACHVTSQACTSLPRLRCSMAFGPVKRNGFSDHLIKKLCLCSQGG